MTINGQPIGSNKPVRPPTFDWYTCPRCGRAINCHISQRSATGLCMSCRSHGGDTPTRGQAWMERAACITVGWALFFPSDADHAMATRAKDVCAACPVRALCLDYALTNNLREGVFGGLTPSERRPLHRAQGKA